VPYIGLKEDHPELQAPGVPTRPSEVWTAVGVARTYIRAAVGSVNPNDPMLIVCRALLRVMGLRE